MPLSYEEQWSELRRRNRNALIVFVVGMLAVIPIATWLARVAEIHGDAFVLLAVATAWLLAVAFFAFRITRFRCPRCNSLYFSHHGERMSFGHARKCASCGLRVYAQA